MSFPVFGELVEETPEKFPEFGEIIEEKPSFKKEVGRNVARSGIRAVESLAGLPGDIFAIPEKIISSGLSKLTGTPEEKIRKAGSGLGLPTSESLRGISQKIFGQKFEPQSEGEKLSDDIIQDAVALAIPVKGKIPFLRSIGTSIAGNLASKGAEIGGLGETGQSAAKLGAFFLSGLTGKGTVKKFWNQQYEAADKAVPKTATMDAFKLERNLDKLESTLKQGLETPSQKAVLKPLKELRKKISNGKMSVKDAIQSKKSINELRAQLFDEVKGEAARKGASTKLNDIAQFLDEGLGAYGKQNPGFYEPYKAANEAYAGYQQSRKVGKFINRLLPMGNLSKGALLLLEGIFKPATLPYTAAGYTAFKGGELLARMFKNPTLRKYYSGVVQSAIKENKTGVLRNIKGLDKEVQKHPEIFEGLTGSDHNAD